MIERRWIKLELRVGRWADVRRNDAFVVVKGWGLEWLNFAPVSAAGTVGASGWGDNRLWHSLTVATRDVTSCTHGSAPRLSCSDRRREWIEVNFSFHHCRLALAVVLLLAAYYIPYWPFALVLFWSAAALFAVSAAYYCNVHDQ